MHGKRGVGKRVMGKYRNGFNVALTLTGMRYYLRNLHVLLRSELVYRPGTRTAGCIDDLVSYVARRLEGDDRTQMGDKEHDNMLELRDVLDGIRYAIAAMDDPNVETGEITMAQFFEKIGVK